MPVGFSVRALLATSTSGNRFARSSTLCGRSFAGEIYLSPEMASILVQRAAHGNSIDDDPASVLTNRELEIFELIGRGVTTQQIAGKLLLSPRTVETHRKNIKRKLNLANGSQLNRAAFQWIHENL